MMPTQEGKMLSSLKISSNIFFKPAQLTFLLLQFQILLPSLLQLAKLLHFLPDKFS